MIFRLASAGALAAAASMVATPIAAAELSRTAMPIAVGAPAVFDADAVNADGYRRWHRRDRVDAGDVIAGVLVLGTIAAVASAASKASRERDYRYPQRYPSAGDRYDYRAAPNAPYDTRGGIDRAVDTCAREIERNVRIDTVDGVDRYGAGWRVSGRLSDGAPFTCAIDGSGRIEGVDYGRLGAAEDRQWDDDRYAAARQAQGGAMPAYPGGPVGDDGADDGRYQAGQAPDFSN